MSGRLMGRVMRTEMHPTGKLVLLAYAYFANDAGEQAFPSIETVAELSSLGERTVKDWVRTLREQRYLIPDGTTGHRTKRYKINLEMLEKSAAPALYPEEPATEPDKKSAAPALYPNEEPKKSAAPALYPEEEQKKSAAAALINDEKGAAPALYLKKSAGNSKKSAAAAPESLRNTNPLNSEEEEEAAPAAAGPSWVITAEQAERTWTSVTQMVVIPGGIDERGLAINALCSLAPVHGPGLADYLRPFYQALTLAKTKESRPYSRTNLCWLTEWANAGTLPEYILRQLRMHKPSSLPKELAEWMLARDKAAAGANGNGSAYSSATAEAARSLGLVEGTNR